MPTPHSASYPSAPSATSSASAVSNTGSYPGLAEYMGLELTEAEVRANMPEYLPAVVQVLNICEAIFCLTLAPNRAAALPLCLELALLHPYLAWLLAWPKHRWGSNSWKKKEWRWLGEWPNQTFNFHLLRQLMYVWQLNKQFSGNPRGEATRSLQEWWRQDWPQGEGCQQRFSS